MEGSIMNKSVLFRTINFSKSLLFLAVVLPLGSTHAQNLHPKGSDSIETPKKNQNNRV